MVNRDYANGIVPTRKIATCEYCKTEFEYEHDEQSGVENCPNCQGYPQGKRESIYTGAAKLLVEAANTYQERNAVYGDNYKRVGAMLDALFPDGLSLKTAHDHERMHIFMLIIVKLSRYCVNWDDGGHKDSIHDAAVYCAMLEEIDSQ